jgi:hypothetical protein
MQRRSLLKAVGALVVAGHIPKASASEQTSYIQFLDSLIAKLEANKRVDVWALEEILDKLETPIAWYYCRDLYMYEPTR